MPVTLNRTKYPDNIRTISGTVDVNRDDVVLLCDTSAGPVTVNLGEIPPGFWSTSYRVYVVDAADNAGTNNITIVAPTGPPTHKINNQPTLVLNTNGEGCMIRILDDTNYVATLNTTSNAATGFIALTVLQLQALITAGTVVQGTYYLVTDANLSDLGIVVQGITSTTVSLEGKGLFYVADYMNTGGNNLGVWNVGLPPLTAGVSIVIWNGVQYLSLTGVVGSAPDTDAVNWQLLPKSTENTYILECDDVRYDPFISAGVDRLMYRADKRQNEIEYVIYKGRNGLVQFQWGYYDENFPTGAIGSYGNKALAGGYIDNLNQGQRARCIANVVKNNSAIEMVTNIADVVENTVINSSILIATNNGGEILRNVLDTNAEVTLTNQSTSGDFTDNKIQNGGTVDIDDNQSFVTENFIHTNGRLAVAINQSRLERNEIGASFDVDLASPNTLAYNDKRAVSGFSNFDAILDLNDGSIYSGTALTIPLSLDYIGVFNLSNSNKTVNTILNLPTTHDCKFVTATNLEVTTYTSVAVAGALVNEIIAAQAPGGIQTTGRTNGTDDVVLRKNGNLNAVVGRPNVYQ